MKLFRLSFQDNMTVTVAIFLYLKAMRSSKGEYDLSSQDNSVVSFRTRRKIRPGQEIFVKYGPEFFDKCECHCLTCASKTGETLLPEIHRTGVSKGAIKCENSNPISTTPNHVTLPCFTSKMHPDVSKTKNGGIRGVFWFT